MKVIKRSTIAGLSDDEADLCYSLGIGHMVMLLAGYLVKYCGWTFERVQHGLEVFAGVKSLTMEMIYAGLTFKTFEIHDCPYQDFLSPAGFLGVFGQIAKCYVGGLLHWATVCSSWVYLNLGTSHRVCYNPLGTNAGSVRDGNIMVSRMCFLILFSVVRKVHWLLEQPLSSKMQEHPKMRLLQRLRDETVLDGHEAHGWMGAYGARTPKASKWEGSPAWVSKLGNSLTKSQLACLGDDQVVVRDATKGSVTGGKHLKETQAYPHGYGQVVANLFGIAFSKHEVPPCRLDRLSEISRKALLETDWSDMELGGLFSKLEKEL